MEETEKKETSAEKNNDTDYVNLSIKILYYILGIIETLLAIRFFLLFFGANIYAGFSQLIRTLTDPLMAPFVGLFPPVQGDIMTFSLSNIAAMVVYALVFYGIVRLIRIITAKH